MIRIPTAVILLVVLAIFTTGCRKSDANRAPIRGEVKLDGQPLEKGSILFVPMDGVKGIVAGGPIENGRYQISSGKGAAVGWNRVEIRSPRNTGKTIQQPYGPGTSSTVEIVQMVAPRFNTKSTLKVEVKPGENTADFDVVSK
jgi:hypothetical protein